MQIFQAESWREYFVVVNPVYLGVPHGGKAGFQLLDRAVRVLLDLEYPFELYHKALDGLAYQLPCLHAQ